MEFAILHFLNIGTNVLVELCADIWIFFSNGNSKVAQKFGSGAHSYNSHDFFLLCIFALETWNTFGLTPLDWKRENWNIHVNSSLGFIARSIETKSYYACSHTYAEQNSCIRAEMYVLCTSSTCTCRSE